MERSTRVYVAGADTLMGAAIVTALRRDGYDVLDGVGEVEVARPASVRQFFERHRPEHVIVAAGRSAGITGNQRFPADLIHDNLLVVTHVIHEAWRSGTQRLMFLASSCSYPKLAPQPMRPDSLLTGPLEPTSQSYAVAKLAGIQMCAAYSGQHGVEFFAAIPADAFGPGDDFSPEDSHVVAGLMRRMHEAKVARAPSIDIWGSGRQRREFMYADDLASACVFAMQRYTGDGPLNLGGGFDTSIAELARAIREVVGFEGELRFDTSKPDGMPYKALDSSELRTLGWQPSVAFHDGLVRTYRWFLDHEAQLVRDCSAVQEPTETIPVQDSQSAQRELASIQQQLSHTQEKLADARQELTGVRSRQKSLVSELSSAISSLQQLRDQLHERDRSLAAMNQKSDSTEKELKRFRKGENEARDKLRQAKERLNARDQELADLRERKLVRIAIKVGNLIRRCTSASALWQR